MTQTAIEREVTTMPWVSLLIGILIGASIMAIIIDQVMAKRRNII